VRFVEVVVGADGEVRHICIQLIDMSLKLPLPKANRARIWRQLDDFTGLHSEERQQSSASCSHWLALLLSMRWISSSALRILSFSQRPGSNPNWATKSARLARARSGGSSNARGRCTGAQVTSATSQYVQSLIGAQDCGTDHLRGSDLRAEFRAGNWGDHIRHSRAAR
jgi:hypothetical protein